MTIVEQRDERMKRRVDHLRDAGEQRDAYEAQQRLGASVFHRLWFVWFALVTALVTVPLSITQIITHQFWPTAHNFKRWSSLWGRAILRLSGVRVKVAELTPLDATRSYVFVANHQNTLDILALAGYLPYSVGFVAKEELAKVPMLGFAIRNSASIFINRRDRQRWMESLRVAGERIRAGTSVLMYPEGSRSFSATMCAFKKGAFMLAVEAGVPLVPVTVLGAHRLLDERVYAGRPGRIRIVVGTPFDVAAKNRADVPEMMQAAREQMEATLQQRSGTAIE